MRSFFFTSLSGRQQNKTHHIFNLYRQKSGYTVGDLLTKRSGECSTDQIQKWPGGRRINQRAQNNKQEPEPWNNKTRVLGRDSRKAHNGDIYGRFYSPPVESEQIYEVSRGCGRDRLVGNWIFYLLGYINTHRTHRKVTPDAFLNLKIPLESFGKIFWKRELGGGLNSQLVY